MLELTIILFIPKKTKNENGFKYPIYRGDFNFNLRVTFYADLFEHEKKKCKGFLSIKQTC
jgi:hypothetical protein